MAVISHWSLVIGHWSLVIGHYRALVLSFIVDAASCREVLVNGH
ncbi:hypothetical protein [Nostoc sp. ChiSLP03a]|nr:hypothetical protein [Nostoc sp. ChiSLP03a]MDZ8209990.1 hypothetical protein [Nostoc sp. ChiSLP03a]